MCECAIPSTITWIRRNMSKLWIYSRNFQVQKAPMDQDLFWYLNHLRLPNKYLLWRTSTPFLIPFHTKDSSLLDWAGHQPTFFPYFAETIFARREFGGLMILQAILVRSASFVLLKSFTPKPPLTFEWQIRFRPMNLQKWLLSTHSGIFKQLITQLDKTLVTELMRHVLLSWDKWQVFQELLRVVTLAIRDWKHLVLFLPQNIGIPKYLNPSIIGLNLLSLHLRPKFLEDLWGNRTENLSTFINDPDACSYSWRMSSITFMFTLDKMSILKLLEFGSSTLLSYLNLCSW